MTIDLNFKSDLKVRWLYRLLLVMIAGGGDKNYVEVSYSLGW